MGIIRMNTKRKVDKLGGNGKKEFRRMYLYTTRIFFWACSLLLLGCGLPFTKREEKNRRRKSGEKIKASCFQISLWPDSFSF